MELKTDSTPKIVTFKNIKQTSCSTRIMSNKLCKNSNTPVPIQTRKQNKFFNKPFTQTFHITDIKN